jgi:alpha-L-fucosidase 2
MTISFSTISRRGFLGGTASLAAASAAKLGWTAPTAAPESRGYILHFAQPAATWPDALPVGNGRLGAMVVGQVIKERIQLNEESIWDGEIRDRNNPKAGEAVPRIRELLFAGKVAEAEALAISAMMSIPRRMPCYQTLGDLHLDFSASGLTPDTKVDDYRLELNLDTAIARTTFRHNGTTYTREVFSSAPDQVIVIRVTADGPDTLNFTARLDRPAHFETASTGADRLVLSGEAIPVNDNPGLPVKERPVGVRFYSELLATTEGGTVKSEGGVLTIANARTATLYIDCATSYRYPAHSSSPDRYNVGDLDAMKAAVDRNLKVAADHSYADLRARHIADHQRYFRRAEINLGPDRRAVMPTDIRLLRVKNGDEDIHLLPLYFQFGRYLLISSSRPGTLAANLQGIWNESVDPPWGSKYTININTEMNYWLADRANLSDCHLPLFDLEDSTRRSGTLTAQRYYRARGFVVHHNTDIWGDSGPIDTLGGGIWPMGAAWLSLHAWDHYDYTRDLRFLRERGYPLLRDNALFLLDYLVEAPTGTPYAGMLITGPSCSPENKYKLPDGSSHNLCMGPTMDIEITRAVLTRTIAAHQALGAPAAESDLITRAHAALKRLPPFKITHDGRLQEWPEDYTDSEPGHRHISHLFALFPEDQITPHTTPDLARACRATLDKRLAAGGGSTGWSRSWIINCFARLQDGDAAYQSILHLLRKETRPNLFDVCGEKENSPYQIDGNLGAPTGMIEMLLQSHAGVIRLLPALPSAWPSGTFRGLRARGGIEVDLTWSNGKVTQGTLRATTDATIHVAPPRNQTIAGHQPDGDGLIPLTLKAGQTVQLSFT